MFYCIFETPERTTRVFVCGDKESLKYVSKILNVLSVWGGYDKEGRNFLSWEFKKDMIPAVHKILQKYGGYIDSGFETRWIDWEEENKEE